MTLLNGNIPMDLVRYFDEGNPLVCDMDVSPFACEFWPLEELAQINLEYRMAEYAPGYFAFASSGGGETFAFGPKGEIVCLPAIGMEPSSARTLAPSFRAFEILLREAK